MDDLFQRRGYFHISEAFLHAYPNTMFSILTRFLPARVEHHMPEDEYVYYGYSMDFDVARRETHVPRYSVSADAEGILVFYMV